MGQNLQLVGLREGFLTHHVCSNDETELTLIYFTVSSNLVPYAFVWEKVKTMDFTDVPVDSKTVSPGGCMPPCSGPIYMYLMMKQNV